MEAHTKEQFQGAQILFSEYVDHLGVDLTFQNFQHELANLETIYTNPFGSLILADDKGRYIGCVGLRRFGAAISEMKRLYIRPEARGKGLGLILCQKIIAKAKALGYQKLRLDTLPTMKTARQLYNDLGFYSIEPYYENPIQGTTFMELKLS